MSVLKELNYFMRFFFETAKEDKQIVFYAEHEGYYPNFEGLIDQMVKTKNQSICYVTSDSHDPILEKSDNQIQTFYFNSLLPFFMFFVDCKVFVMTLTDLGRYHLKRSVHPVHYVYVFHSMVSVHMSYREGSFDNYDSLLCVGPYQVVEIRKIEKMKNLPEKELVEAGYYRLERIHNEFHHNCQHKSQGDGRIKVLIAPSWGKDNVIESCGERLVKALLDHDLDVIVRPHPETVRRNPALIEALSTQLGGNPHFTLEKSVATDDSLLQSDILICDCSGIAFEYALGTERPVLFLDVPYKVKNENYKELGIEPLELSMRSQVGKVISPDRINTIAVVIKEMQEQRDEYKSRIAQLRDTNVYAFGKSSQVGADYIENLLGKKNGTGH